MITKLILFKTEGLCFSGSFLRFLPFLATLLNKATITPDILHGFHHLIIVIELHFWGKRIHFCGLGYWNYGFKYLSNDPSLEDNWILWKVMDKHFGAWSWETSVISHEFYHYLQVSLISGSELSFWVGLSKSHRYFKLSGFPVPVWRCNWLMVNEGFLTKPIKRQTGSPLKQRLF